MEAFSKPDLDLALANILGLQPDGSDRFATSGRRSPVLSSLRVTAAIAFSLMLLLIGGGIWFVARHGNQMFERGTAWLPAPHGSPAATIAVPPRSVTARRPADDPPTAFAVSPAPSTGGAASVETPASSGSGATMSGTDMASGRVIVTLPPPARRDTARRSASAARNPSAPRRLPTAAPRFATALADPVPSAALTDTRVTIAGQPAPIGAGGATAREVAEPPDDGASSAPSPPSRTSDREKAARRHSLDALRDLRRQF